MTKKPSRAASPNSKTASLSAGEGGETHQTVATLDRVLTTNQGAPISDNQNSLKSGERGPTLIEDFILREKITHFDHERIPERIVHARGSGAHGYFQPVKSLSKLTRAAFLQDRPRAEVFVQFSTVAGGAGCSRSLCDSSSRSVLHRRATSISSNNIPVFFIRTPSSSQTSSLEWSRIATSAGGVAPTFWDFASLMPEACTCSPG
jgi:catalase